MNQNTAIPLLLSAALFYLLFSLADGFQTQVPRVPTSSTSLYSIGISRRNVLRFSSSFGTLVITGSALRQPAVADVTNKVASQSSLRYIKRSIKEVQKLELYASQNDYVEMKQGIRGPGISEIRKNAVILIRGGEDGPEATNLQNAYDSFIKDIEALDGAASLGIR
jgi:hypothetical protein